MQLFYHYRNTFFIEKLTKSNQEDKGFTDQGGQLVPIRPISQLSVSAGGRELKF